MKTYKHIRHVNDLFVSLKQQTTGVQIAALIHNKMGCHNITFAELNFTKEEFETEERQAIIGHVESMFGTLKQLQGDVRYAGHIRTWMIDHNINFSEVNFTKEEFEKEERRALIGHLNYLFISLKNQTAGVQYAGHILVWMDSNNITFAELNFTKGEFETEVRQTQIRCINNLFVSLQQQGSTQPYADHIRNWMRRHKITFDELSFTKAELKAEEKKFWSQNF